ncbi:unnamed protein product, partial [Brassica oleracea]
CHLLFFLIHHERWVLKELEKRWEVLKKKEKTRSINKISSQFNVKNQSALNMNNNESDGGGGGGSESKRETVNKDEEEKMDGVKEYQISGHVDDSGNWKKLIIE